MGRGSRGQQAVVLGQRMSGPRGRQISVEAESAQRDQTIAAAEALEGDYSNEQAFDQALNTLFAWRRPVAPPDKPEAPSAVYDRQATEYWRGDINRLRRAVWAGASERAVPTIEPAIKRAAEQLDLDSNNISDQVAARLPQTEPALGSWTEQASLDKDQVLSAAQMSAADIASYRIAENLDEERLSQFANYSQWLEGGQRRLLPDRNVSEQLDKVYFHNQIRQWILAGSKEPVDQLIDRALDQQS